MNPLKTITSFMRGDVCCFSDRTDPPLSSFVLTHTGIVAVRNTWHILSEVSMKYKILSMSYIVKFFNLSFQNFTVVVLSNDSNIPCCKLLLWLN